MKIDARQTVSIAARIAATASVMLFCAMYARAQWSSNSAANTPLSVFRGSQSLPKMISDGNGGNIFVWQDGRDSARNGYDLYAQKIDTRARPLWGQTSTVSGTGVYRGAGDQTAPALTPDGLGGAIVTWQDTRNGKADIYAQHVAYDTAKLWTLNGVPVCTATAEQLQPRIVADGAGGAFVTWYDYRSGTPDIYAQHLSAGGTPLWAADGVLICGASDAQIAPAVISDAFGGAIIVWQDYRNGTADIYAQRISGSGTVQWAPDGVPVTSAAGDQQFPVVVSDDQHGAIIAWQDSRSGVNNVYAQRLAYQDGAALWGTDGTPVAAGSDAQTAPSICQDGAGGAIIAWQGSRSASQDIFAQRIVTGSSAGAPLWGGEGVIVCGANFDQARPTLLSNGTGGTIVLWYDYRNSTSTGVDIYGQQLSSTGELLWTSNPDGLPITTAAKDQVNLVVENSAPGTVVLGWQDYRADATAPDLYVQNLNANGTIGYCSVSGSLFNDLNENGTKDGSEPALSGWRVRLSGALNDSLLTDANGNFKFDALLPGSYTVSVAVRPGWRKVYPAADAYSFSMDSLGVSVTGRTFGMFQNAALGGMVYRDVLADGSRNGNDAGLQNWRINASSGSASFDTVTATDGTYNLINLPTGDYIIRLQPTAGWYQVIPADTMHLTVAYGTQYTGKDFGVYQTGSITAKIYDDLEVDSLIAGNDNLAGWSVRLYRDGALQQQGVTASGGVTFGGLTQGIYTLEESLAVGYVQTVPRTTAAGYTDETHGAHPGPRAYEILMDSSGKAVTKTFANYGSASIRGGVFQDLALDGGLSNDTIGVSDQIVRLYRDGVLIARTSTDAHGMYEFDGVELGTYTVEESLRVSSLEDVPPASDTTSRNVTFGAGAGARSYMVFADTSSKIIAGRNFGVFYLGTIQGFAFEDADKNGLFNGEAPMKGRMVRLSGSIDDSAITGSDGSYRFGNLPKGAYTVSVAPETGWGFTTPKDYSVAVDTSGRLALRNFGYTALRSIAGTVFDDFLGHDGVRQSSEGGLGGWTVLALGKKYSTSVKTSGDGSYRLTGLGADVYAVDVLLPAEWHKKLGPVTVDLKSPGRRTGLDIGAYTDRYGLVTGKLYSDLNSNGTVDPGEPAVRNRIVVIDTLASATSRIPMDSVHTTGDGSFTFEGLYPGKYALRQNLPVDWKNSTPDTAFAVTIASSTPHVTSKKLLTFPLARITGIVFDDANANGIRDAGELPLANQTILTGGALSETTVTNSAGRYSFTDLNPGNYNLSIDLHDGWGAIQPPHGARTITLTDTSDAVGNDFALFVPGSITGSVFHDGNADGVREDGEPGIAGNAVYLRGAVPDTVITDEFGNYIFSELRPGTYGIAEAHLPGWFQIGPVSPDTFSLEISRGSAVTRMDFANATASSISGRVYDDKNGNGTRQNGDSGIGGVLVRLSGSKSDSVRTAADGSFTFTGIGLGSFTVSEAVPSGWFQTGPASPKTYVIPVTAPGTEIQEIEFGNFASSVRGTVYLDVNGDSVHTSEEGVIRSRFVTVSGPVSRTDSTTADGSFTISALPPGTYTVRDSLPAGWERTSPSTVYTVAITTSGTVVTTRDFTQFRRIAISGQTFVDSNINGIRDAGEPLVNDPAHPLKWRVLLFRGAVLVDSTLTDDNGAYSFTGIGSGYYTIQERTLTGWDHSAPVAPGSYAVHPKSGTNVTSRDFGNYQFAALSLTARHFKDRNGLLADRDDEVPRAWSFRIYHDSIAAANEVAPASSTPSTVSVSNLAVGSRYIVVPGDSAGWTHLGILRNGGLTSVSAWMDTIVVANPTDRFLIDFIDFAPNSLAVSAASDGDGLTGTPVDRSFHQWGFSVYAGTIGSPYLISSVSNSDSLALGSLGEGTYYVVENDSAGWRHTGYLVDGTASSSSASSVMVTFAGGTSHSVEFLNTPVGSIAVRSLNDMDGSNETTDDRLPKGWRIQLYRDTVTPATRVADSLRADSPVFSNLVAGKYIVTKADSSAWHNIWTSVDGLTQDTAVSSATITVSGPGDSHTVEFASYALSRSKRWTGAVSCEWSDYRNWYPEGVPQPGDSIRMPADTINHCSPEIPSITLGRVVLDTLGSLTVGDESVVTLEGDALVNGVLRGSPGGGSTFIVGGTWTRKGTFFPEHTTVRIRSNASKVFTGGTFAALEIGEDGGELSPFALVRVSGNLTIAGTMHLGDWLNLGSDTLFVQTDDQDALDGPGVISGGTIRRLIAKGLPGSYRFESGLTSLTFDGADEPARVTVSTLANTLPATVSPAWTDIGGYVDTVCHTVTLENVHDITPLLAYSFGEAGGTTPGVKRVYKFSVPFGSVYNGTLMLRYDPSELLPGTDETKLHLFRAAYAPSVTVDSGWHLVASPAGGFTLSDDVFAGTGGLVYEYAPDSGYRSRTTLEFGRGYWLKTPATMTFTRAVEPVLSDTLSLAAGWNLIGGLNVPVDVANVTTIPTGILKGSVFGYNSTGSYVASSTLQPYSGYWMKLKHAGKVVLAMSPDVLGNKTAVSSPSASATITIIDATGKSRTLEISTTGIDEDVASLPPPPPEGVFDIRFVSDRAIEQYKAPADRGSGPSFRIKVEGVVYPVSVRWDLSMLKGVSATLNSGSASVQMSGAGTTSIGSGSNVWDLSMGTVLALPREFALDQNFPNPFNPSTEIRFALPADSRVHLTVYNILGQRVATLVDGLVGAGYQSIRWNATNDDGVGLASGVYFYRIEATSVAAPSRTFTDVKKTVLLR